MKNWEYYIVQNMAAPTHQGIFGHSPDGDRTKLSEESGMQQVCLVLNKMGGEGWEVVGTSSEGFLTNWTLKRAI